MSSLPEDEDVEDGQVQRKSQHKLPNDQPGQGFIRVHISCSAVVDC